MIGAAIAFAFACFTLAMVLNLWRLGRGPTPGDRVLALDTMTVDAIALIVLWGLHQGTNVYFEAATLYALTGFVATVAFCRYLIAEMAQ